MILRNIGSQTGKHEKADPWEQIRSQRKEKGKR
jgi:hypothetical protein